MLTALDVSNYAIVSQLHSEWHSGMTTITGETGAGKSIAIDALSLCLGSRADASAIRPGQSQAHVSASFDIRNNQAACAYLDEHDIPHDGECLIRRVLKRSGRSKIYINGVAVTTSQAKEVGQYLVAIHGQHAHQLLTKSEHQIQLLDNYANHPSLLANVKDSAKTYKALISEQKQLEAQLAEHNAHKQLLEYQVAEFNELAPEADEFKTIEANHKRLSHAQYLLEHSQQEAYLLHEGDDNTLHSQLKQSVNRLAKLVELDPALTNIVNLLDEATVQVEEAARELSHYGQNIDIDPEHLAECDVRLAQLLDLARKHQVAPEALHSHQQALVDELAALQHSDARLEALESEIAQAFCQYQSAAKALFESRSQAAKTLGELISQSMQSLAMEQGQFAVEISHDETKAPSEYGSDAVSFVVSTNPGQPMQALQKVASGGELSRISLAMQVILATQVTTPTLIFDEVDVGISGPTAAVVGKLLRQLGKDTQVICVTHLPQVASSGHQQFFVAKYSDGAVTHTSMQMLGRNERVDEIARLLGGQEISAATRKNAKELIAGFDKA